MRIQVNRLHHPVTALGPGVRAGIWLQGCSIECRGCLSRDTWPQRPQTETDVAAVLEWVASLAPELDGITISGGEPFDQPAALRDLLAGLSDWHADLGRELDLLCYSGYSLSRLRRCDEGALELLDAAIVGPYVRERPTRLIWRGSANQELVPLSPLGRSRYGPYLRLRSGRPQLQVAVGADSVRCIGIPRVDDMERVERRLAQAGIELGWASWNP